MFRTFVIGFLGILLGVKLSAEAGSDGAPREAPKSTLDQHPEWFRDPRQLHESESEFLARRAEESARQTVQIINRTGNVFTGESGGGTGTGFILSITDEEIVIVTNEHVVGRGAHESQAIAVAFTVPGAGDEFVPADSVKVSYDRDVAIVKVSRAAVKRAQPQEVFLPKSVEHFVYAQRRGRSSYVFGNPLGVRNVLTRGVISGTIPNMMRDPVLHTDAAINGGNSGGPLYDLDTGAVVGVATLKLVSAAIEAFGMAIPIVFVLDEIERLIQGKHDASQGYIFGRSQRVPIELLEQTGRMTAIDEKYPDLRQAQQLFKPSAKGLQFVSDIDESTGLKRGDIIIKVGGAYVGGDEQAVIQQVRLSPGRRITFEVLRGDQFLSVDVEVQDQLKSLLDREKHFVSLDGLILQMPLLNEAGDYMRGEPGLIVTEIVPESHGDRLARSGHVAKYSVVQMARVGNKTFQLNNIEDVYALEEYLKASKSKIVELHILKPVIDRSGEAPRVVMDSNELPHLARKTEILFLNNPELISSKNGEFAELRAAFAELLHQGGGSWDFLSEAKKAVATCRFRVASLGQQAT